MKKKLCIFILICYLLSMSACADRADQSYRSPVNFYYRTEYTRYNTTDSVIQAEIRESEGIDIGDELSDVINLYFQGPESSGFRSPFPQDVTLKRCSINNGVLQVILSNHISQLKGYDLTIACACLTKTLLELTDAKTVEIRAEGGRMGDSISVTMSHDTLLLLDNCTQADSTTP